jgi:chromosome segregation ATPase
MATLFELASWLQELYEADDLLEREDTLQLLEGEFEDKLDGYCKLIRCLEADKSALKGEIDRLSGRKGSLERKIDRLKENLQHSMEALDKPKVKTAMFTAWIQGNTPSVQIIDKELIPGRFLVPQEPEIDKAAIKKAISGGGAVPGAELAQSRSIRIK